MVRLPRNEKHTYRLISRPQMWPSGLTLVMTLTLNFQGQISNWLYLCQKWSDCQETKSEHIDWTLGLKCSHQIWPWPWPWPWIFKVKYEICYISTKSGPIATRRKANISIWTLGLKFDNGFDLAMILMFEFSRSYVILTIWWPRSGVRIYQIVTGVTSVVGVPSTHLVCLIWMIFFQNANVCIVCVCVCVCVCGGGGGGRGGGGGGGGSALTHLNGGEKMLTLTSSMSLSLVYIVLGLITCRWVWW